MSTISSKKIKITDYFDRIKLVKDPPDKKPRIGLKVENVPESTKEIKMNRLSDVLNDENLCNLLDDDETYVYYRYPNAKSTVPIPLTDEDDYSVPLNYVELPFQEINTTIIYEGVRYTKWSLVKKIFSSQIENIFQLVKAIKTYNPSIKDIHFDILTNYVKYQLNDNECKTFFNKLLPDIIRLALDLPRLFCFNLANLDQGTSMAIFLSQEQISSLLANAFLCTYSEDLSKKERRCINFTNLFSTNGCAESKKFCKLEKLKCLITYLRRVTQQTPVGTVSFERKVLLVKPSLEESQKSIKNFEFNYDQCLIADGCNYSQVDFAHKFIGGGILDVGCVQEEILFAACPELIVSKLICAKLLDNEAVIITGVEQFNQFIGYAEKFKWQSSHLDKQGRDKYGRRFRQILAMDALYFRWSTKSTQYEKNKIDREIMKAITAFQPERFLIKKNQLSTIATGNWGCGVYHGDPYIKTLIQIIAASEMQRDLIYFTFHNLKLKNDFDQIKLLIQTNKHTVTVAKLYRLLIQYAKDRAQKKFHLDLVSYLSGKLG